MILLGLLVALGALFAVAWLVGWVWTESNKSLKRRKPMTVGFIKLAGTPKAAWKRRSGIVSGLAVATLCFTVVCWLMALLLRRNDRPLTISMGVVFIGCSVLAYWYCKTDGWRRSWSDVSEEHIRVKEALAAVTVTHPESVPGKPVIGNGFVEVPVQYVGAFEPELVGQVMHGGYAELVPGAEMGRASVRVSEEPPEPPKPTWHALRDRGPLVLPQPDPRGKALPKLGEDEHGNVHELPPIVDPEHGRSLLLAGVIGSGKTVGIDTLLVQEAWREHIAWVGLDPHRVELRPWSPRMVHVARGIEACVQTVDRLVKLMDARLAHMDREGVAEWRIGSGEEGSNTDGPGVLWIADEFAAFPKSSWEAVARLCAEQRKMGMGCIIATQRPEAKDVMPLNIRDNLRTRIAFATMSTDASKMILGDRPQGAPDPTEIPEWLAGGYVLLLSRTRMTGRTYIPTLGGTSKHDVAEYVAWTANATAHLNAPLEL